MSASTAARRATRITVAPAAASCAAAAAPMPDEAPVIRMRLPRSSIDVRDGGRGSGRMPANRSDRLIIVSNPQACFPPDAESRKRSASRSTADRFPDPPCSTLPAVAAHGVKVRPCAQIC